MWWVTTRKTRRKTSTDERHDIRQKDDQTSSGTHPCNKCLIQRAPSSFQVSLQDEAPQPPKEHKRAPEHTQTKLAYKTCGKGCEIGVDLDPGQRGAGHGKLGAMTHARTRTRKHKKSTPQKTRVPKTPYSRSIPGPCWLYPALSCSFGGSENSKRGQARKLAY